MNPYFPHLFSPLKVKNLTFKNRIMMAPTSLKELTDHNYLDYHTFEYLERRAMGGVAAINLGDAIVLEKPLEAYAEILKEEVQNRDREAEMAKWEMKGLLESLKATAKLRLERGEYQVAKEILLQTKQYAPEDEEIEELLERVEQ